MRKILSILILIGSIFTLAGCENLTFTIIQDHTFEGGGVEVTLTTEFTEREPNRNKQILWLTSKKHMFDAYSEPKAPLVSSNIKTLEQYMKAVLVAGNKADSEILEGETSEGVRYLYAYYENEGNDKIYKYMLLTFEGAETFYTMNFGCLTENFDANLDQYKKWAATIKIE